MTFANALLKAKNKQAEYPSDHRPGMKVPKGGSSCAKCEYLDKASTHMAPICNNRYFIKWNGSRRLPAPADEYCSDWFEAAK